MKDVEYFRWEYPRPGHRTWGKTGYLLTAEDAAIRFPGSRPIPNTRVVRRLPETEDEAYEARRRAPRSPAPGSEADLERRDKKP